MSSVKELNTVKRYDLRLLACGYPMGGPLYCGTLYYQDMYDFMWATSGVLIPGMSGGPVMLEDGTVVALNISVKDNESMVSPIYNIDAEFRSK